MEDRACPQCGTINRGGAKYCQKCGLMMEKTVPMTESRDFLSGIIDELEEFARDTKDALRKANATLFGGKSKPASRSEVPARREVLRVETAPRPGPPPTRLIAQPVLPKSPGETIGGYVIQSVRSMQRSNFYVVRIERCSQGHISRGVNVERCQTCQAELKAFLVRETEMPRLTGNERKRRALIELSRSGAPGFLPHVAIFDEDSSRYTVCEFPGEGWLSLSQVSLPVTDHAQMVSWGTSLGSALIRLYEQGFLAEFSSLAEYLEPIIVTASQQAALMPQAVFADLAVFNLTALPPQAAQQKIIAYLAQVIYVLASGKQQNLHRAPRDFSDLPAPFRGLVSRATRDEFADLSSFLEALKTAFKLPGSTRSLRQIAGYCTDVGRKRGHNEDFVGKYSLGMQQASEVGLYLVADGMGGHQAGESASREVVRVILDDIQDRVQELQAAPKLKRATIKIDQVVSPGEVLKGAILKANEVLYNARQKVGSDRGTTLTAALIVGEMCAVANVGDSRTYLYREGQLRQLTQDHSLVASLVAASIIQPDEVRVHPQRSQIYRNLGDRPVVEVDIYECALYAGDRLLLCSDGLWEMVVDAEIQQILRQSTNPQEACDRFIEAANLGGGEDNISAVAVWMA